MKDVRCRRVVDDENFGELPAAPAEVLDVVSAVEDTGFAEEPRAEHVPLVEQVGHRVGVLEQEEFGNELFDFGMMAKNKLWNSETIISYLLDNQQAST